MGGLIAYDLLILREGGRAAFSKKRDLLLLALAVPILLLIAAESASDAASLARRAAEPVKLVAAAGAAFMVNFMVSGRLLHLGTESLVARQALRRAPRRAYRLFCNALPLAASLLLLAAGPLSAVALMLTHAVGGAAGVMAHRMKPRFRRRRSASGMRPLRLAAAEQRRRILALTAARTGMPIPSIAANAAAFAAIGAVAALGYRIALALAPQPVPHLLAAAAALIAFAHLSRQDAPLLRYLLYLGFGPVLPALVRAAAFASFAAAFALAAAVLGLPDASTVATIAAAAALLFLLFTLLRALHYATRPKRTAELALQIDILALLLAAWLALPLAPALLAARLLMLQRRARDSRYVVP